MKKNLHNQSQSTREISKEGIQPKKNLVFATKNQGIGNPSNNDWGNISKFQTNSIWNKVSAKDKRNASKVNWKSLWHDEEIFKEGIRPKRNPAFATKNQAIGNPSHNGWGNFSKFQTNSSWNKVSAKDKRNASKVKWKPFWILMFQVFSIKYQHPLPTNMESSKELLVLIQQFRQP